MKMRLSKCLKHVFMLSASLSLYACIDSPSLEITIKQEENGERLREMIEVPAATWKQILQKEDESVVLLDQTNKEIPYQITHEGNLIFPFQLKTKEHHFTLKVGKPQPFQSAVYGRQYPERADDITWENDCSAYRAYGPALQKAGERAFGYDIMTKKGEELAIEKRYAMELDKELRGLVNQWRKEGKRNKADSLERIISYHVDHGNGMDCYNVGATLGGGTNALMQNGEIVYPYCYKDYKILDNGPLRFKVELTFHPTTVGNNEGVVEKRLITLDKYSHLNKTIIRYENLKENTQLAAGIVIHPQNKDGYLLEENANYIAYVDSTNNIHANNGLIYVGAVFPNKPEVKTVQWFDDEEAKSHPGALGHVLAISNYQPNTDFIYYWGSGWSKNDLIFPKGWTQYLKDFEKQIKSPLTVTYEVNK